MLIHGKYFHQKEVSATFIGKGLIWIIWTIGYKDKKTFLQTNR